MCLALHWVPKESRGIAGDSTKKVVENGKGTKVVPRRTPVGTREQARGVRERRVWSGTGGGVVARVDGESVAGEARAGGGAVHGELWRARGGAAGIEWE